MRFSGGRALRNSALVVALMVVLAGCDWATFHAGADRTGFAPFETKINVTNVGTLSQARTYPDASFDPVVANGVLYTLSNKLTAYDATGKTGCTGNPVSCTPLWTAAAAYPRGATVANGVVYVMTNYYLLAYDAAGSTNCSGSPKVCQPLWSTAVMGFLGASPAVVNGVVYVTGGGDGAPLTTGGAYVLAFDAGGSKNCGGAPKICAPLWTTTGPPSGTLAAAGSVAVSGGVVYIGAVGKLMAFDANGSTNCSGSPAVCSPLWTSSAIPNPIYSTPSISNGTVFLGGYNKTLYAFDAAGTTNCSGSPKVCNPIWTAATSASVSSTAAIANNVVYVVSADGTLAAFDATGTTNCSGMVKTCTPLWTFAPGGSGYLTSSSPAVANGIVYYMDVTGTLQAVDATGTTNCSGSPKQCTALWSASSGKSGDGSPAVANGIVYVDRWGVNTVYAYAH